MKTAKFSIVAVLTLLGVAAGANEKVIELPPAVFSNNRAVEIGRVTLSDTDTVLDISAFYHPGWWIKIASDSYLPADGKKYMIRCGQGADLDSLYKKYQPLVEEYSRGNVGAEYLKSVFRVPTS